MSHRARGPAQPPALQGEICKVIHSSQTTGNYLTTAKSDKDYSIK